jgi:hypothetical protein
VRDFFDAVEAVVRSVEKVSREKRQKKILRARG